MIDGFVIVYKNQTNNVILYFYPGYDNDSIIYEKIDSESMNISPNSYSYCEYDDGAQKFTFKNKITKIQLKLIEHKTHNIINKTFIV